MTKKVRFPLLTEFARGYLHQDMTAEYGDVQNAAKAYIADLNGDERKALVIEARKMAVEATKWDNDEVNQQLRRMGASARVHSKDDFLQLLRMLESAR